MVKEPSKWKIFGLIIVWVLFWTKIGIPFLMNLSNKNPDLLPIPGWWVLHNIGYLAAMYFVFTRIIDQPKAALKVAVGATLLFIGIYDLLLPPFCIQRDGNILMNGLEKSCLFSHDTLIAWFFSFFTGGFGNPALYYLTYTLGTILVTGLGVLLLSQKELISTLKESLKR